MRLVSSMEKMTGLWLVSQVGWPGGGICLQICLFRAQQEEVNPGMEWEAERNEEQGQRDRTFIPSLARSPRAPSNRHNGQSADQWL